MGILGILLITIGVTMIVKPSILWILTESWKSNDGTEPSSLYKWSTRFGGIMITIAGIGSIIIYLL
ncbi:hypothetical protein FS935_00475 [Metabacillus litoralis]|uniref:DUF6199 domain-containing protein n=1 Tax=Metabacillus litoralis TaxID=152268 RepID=A0A5C6W8D4_9BACI|nr:DUF6199 family natural product biosynthesis protein [Metabacillus litoralis]TXC92720.1 hypothetical protein FS935_00475 [Metabacillus litoralis]